MTTNVMKVSPLGWADVQQQGDTMQQHGDTILAKNYATDGDVFQSCKHDKTCDDDMSSAICNMHIKNVGDDTVDLRLICNTHIKTVRDDLST